MTIEPGNLHGQPTTTPADVANLGMFGGISVRLAI